MLVGFLYIAPPLIIAGHLRDLGQPFILNFNVHRDDLFYLGRAKEIYDGHFPPSDPFSDTQPPTVQNPLSSTIVAAFIWLTGGNVTTAYLLAQFILAPISFLIFYWLGQMLFKKFNWAILFAYIGVLTPIALRILNFNGA